jgi:hypothetical protein
VELRNEGKIDIQKSNNSGGRIVFGKVIESKEPADLGWEKQNEDAKRVCRPVRADS